MTLVFLVTLPTATFGSFVVSDLYPTLIHSVLFLCATAVDSDLHLQ